MCCGCSSVFILCLILVSSGLNLVRVCFGSWWKVVVGCCELSM